MAMNAKRALVTLVFLIIIVFVLQLVVGVLGDATSVIGNTLTTAAGSNSLAVTQFNQVAAVTSVIIPFIQIVVLVAIVTIILDLFGAGDLLNVSGSEGF
jgi:ACR3 family arsenite efflux pump ArsB